jgi:hypothetical protein
MIKSHVTFACRDWRKARKTSVFIVGILAGIRTECKSRECKVHQSCGPLLASSSAPSSFFVDSCSLLFCVLLTFLLFPLLNIQKVGAMGWTAEELRFDSRKVQDFFFAPRRPDRLWGQCSLLSNGYWGPFPQGWSDRGVKLTTHLHLVPRPKTVELYLHSRICLHSMVLN